VKPFDKPIYVTRPTLPPIAEFRQGLEEIWDNQWLSNRGPVARRLEKKLAEVLQTKNLSLFTNGTLALEIALQGLRLSGEVVTTPFTFAASTNALTRAGLKPVFADIEPDHFNLDPDRVAAAITPRTTAILAVHVFGIPCRLAALAAIAERCKLLLIYDAAHAFGVTVDGASIAGFGDVSMFSFHATKPFHTGEGGALTFRRTELKDVFDTLANHGLEPGGDVREPGTNGKMTELQALMGELMLERFAPAIAQAGLIEAVYRERLAEVPGIDASAPPPVGVRVNHAFMPALVEPCLFGLSRDALDAALQRYNVFPRKYFHPLVSGMTAYRQDAQRDPLDCARRVSEQVLALPIYAELAIDDVHRICDLIAAIQRRHSAPKR
jgi:dTDP-4-amino-4,6-dideoxygalactose transaminase